jgi:hypothetical protein
MTIQRFGYGSGRIRIIWSDPDPYQETLIWIRVAPKIKEVSRILRAMPPTQVSVERLFSALKLQKSDLQNQIKADVLDALLLLKANSDYLFKK